MRRYLFLLLFLPLICLSLQGRTRKPSESVQPSVEVLLAPLVHTSPVAWHRGMPFVFVGDRVGLSLVPEVPSVSADTASMYGSVWTYDSMVSEEDWMGQQLLQLRFLSPDGHAYRYSTGRPLATMSDTAYHPAIEPLYPLQLVQQCDSLLRARTLYILYNDERVFYAADSVQGANPHQKFVPVRIDSVTIGNVLAPLCVHFSVLNAAASSVSLERGTTAHASSGSPDRVSAAHASSGSLERGTTAQVSSDSLEHGHFFTSLPGSRQVATSTPITRFLSVTDPYLAHPDITREIWSKIQYSQVQPDMTAEEVRLSWGRPSRVERAPSRNGMIELWYYSNNRILQLWDGRLSKVGIL